MDADQVSYLIWFKLRWFKNTWSHVRIYFESYKIGLPFPNEFKGKVKLEMDGSLPCDFLQWHVTSR